MEMKPMNSINKIKSLKNDLNKARARWRRARNNEEQSIKNNEMDKAEAYATKLEEEQAIIDDLENQIEIAEARTIKEVKDITEQSEQIILSNNSEKESEENEAEAEAEAVEVQVEIVTDEETDASDKETNVETNDTSETFESVETEETTIHQETQQIQEIIERIEHPETIIKEPTPAKAKKKKRNKDTLVKGDWPQISFRMRKEEYKDFKKFAKEDPAPHMPFFGTISKMTETANRMIYEGNIKYCIELQQRLIKRLIVAINTKQELRTKLEQNMIDHFFESHAAETKEERSNLIRKIRLLQKTIEELDFDKLVKRKYESRLNAALQRIDEEE